ncbi:NAD-dependent epimerase/dehydratase family protein [Variovorax sp. ZS18.2.2]|uniref:NAD-dependent epimerase/dehydratase family protein n=1 Tax=Variovorax sp. ZS18.2.2 TaxID=2971255 RepID=UPI00215113CD|nr:NAD-dependent epimerase/dehydratase family protein [Variovorax sp. ZS18.2.2]MCR6477494.1 NAD-dependent epimerase/dehydratase family protein [Variovorax sp. ZS18.2.2]
MKCMMTGGSGFIGRSLYPQLKSLGHRVRCGLRHASTPAGMHSADFVDVGSIDAFTDWGRVLFDAEVVVHLAARAHVIRERNLDPLSEFRTVNVQGTLNLARQAADSGVCRFVFISSIGVNGSESVRPFTEVDVPAPQEPYAVSKMEAETGLFEIGKKTGMEVVVIRPPLVYGAGAPGNFGRLIKAVKSGIPLPFGAVHNQRTLVGIDNLTSLIACCIEHPSAANQVFLAGDAEDISTSDLLRLVGESLNRRARLIPVPVALMEAIGSAVGRRATVRKICGSLQIDISKAREVLGWEPPLSAVEGLKRAALEVRL